MATRTYRTARNLTNLEATFDADRQRIDRAALAVAQADRTANGIAPIEPSVLMTAFRTAPADAWTMLAALTEEQLVIQAIDVACYLETQGIELAYGEIRQRWQAKLAEIAATAQAEAEALAALIAANQAHTAAIKAATRPEDYAAASAAHTVATEVYFTVRAKRELLTASTFPENHQCTVCGTALGHTHGGLCQSCYAAGFVGYYIPAWLAPTPPAPVALDHLTKPLLKAPPVPAHPHRNRVGIEICAACATRTATIIDPATGDALCPHCWGLGGMGGITGSGSPVPANPTPPQLPPGVMLVNNKVITGQILADKLYTDRSTRRELMHLFDEMTQDQHREAILLLIRHRQQQERRATLPAVVVA